MQMKDETKNMMPIGNAHVRDDGYLYINDSINFFTGELTADGIRQDFVLGVPVKYDIDKNNRKFAIALKRPDPCEIRKFLFDISDTTAIEMCIDGNDNDVRYATYFYYGFDSICQHSVFSDKSGYNILLENDYDSKGRIVKCYNHGENLITKVTYEQDTFHVNCCEAKGSNNMVIKDVYGYADGTIKGFVNVLGECEDVDNFRYVGTKKNRIIPGTNYDSLVWNIIDFDMDDWAVV